MNHSWKDYLPFQKAGSHSVRVSSACSDFNMIHECSPVSSLAVWRKYTGVNPHFFQNLHKHVYWYLNFWPYKWSTWITWRVNVKGLHLLLYSIAFRSSLLLGLLLISFTICDWHVLYSEHWLQIPPMGTHFLRGGLYKKVGILWRIHQQTKSIVVFQLYWSFVCMVFIEDWLIQNVHKT